MKQLYFATAQDWRAWLSRNHDKEDGLWLIFFKKETGVPTLEYESAVEEALCFGWIDSIIKKIDDTKYARKFTPRKEDSKWSEANKKRVARLIEDRRMTEFGPAKIEAAKKNGRWDQPDRPQISSVVPEAFARALKRHPAAQEAFDRLAPSYRKQFIGWITVAKRPQTKEQRIAESIRLLEQGQKLGLK